MPDINTNGLLPVSTNNTTWVAPTENFPVTLSNQQRGGVMVITGAAGDQLLNINGRLLQDGSIVFNQAQYTEAAGIVRAANTYFRYVSGAARQPDGTVPNASANWQALDTGGGGTGTFTPVADIAALDALATTPPTDEAEFTILDPTGAQNANPAITNLPTPVGGWTADLNLNVQWRAATADWLSLGFTVDNPDARYVNVVGDTMTGPLTIDNTLVDQDALITGEGHDIALGVDSNIVFEGGTGDDNETTLTVIDPTEDRTVSLPDATGTVTLDPDTPAQTTSYVRQVTNAGVASWEVDAGGGVWTKTGTNLSPTTAGDDVLLNVNETLSFTGTDDQDPAGESTITFQAPTGNENFTADYTLTLPPNDGEPNEVLQTNGFGVLDWATVSGSIDVEDSGTSVVATADTLNFTGTGVTVTDAGNNQATIAITGGSDGPDGDPNWTYPLAAGSFSNAQMCRDVALNFTPDNAIPAWATYGRGRVNGGCNSGWDGFSYIDNRGLLWYQGKNTTTVPDYYNWPLNNGAYTMTYGSSQYRQIMFYDGGMADLARTQPNDYSQWLLDIDTGAALDPAPGRGYAMPWVKYYVAGQCYTFAISREGYAYAASGYNGLGACGDGTTSTNYRWNMISFYNEDGTQLLTGPNKPRIRQICNGDAGINCNYTSTGTTYFVSTDNRLWTVGYDYYGTQFRAASVATYTTTAQEVPLSRFDNEEVSQVFPCGSYGTYVLTVTGRLWYSGQNYSGEANNGAASTGVVAGFVTTPYECTSNANSSLHDRRVVMVAPWSSNGSVAGAHILDDQGVIHYCGYSEGYGKNVGITNSGDPATSTLVEGEDVVNSVLMRDAATTMNSDNQRVVSLWASGARYGAKYAITDGGDSGEPKVYTTGYNYYAAGGVGQQNLSDPTVLGNVSNYPLTWAELQFLAPGYMAGSASSWDSGTAADNNNILVGTQYSGDVQNRLDVGRIVYISVSGDSQYDYTAFFIDEHGRGFWCGYTPLGYPIQCWPDGLDPYYSGNGNLNMPAENGYDSNPNGYLNYNFSVQPLVNQPEPFVDVCQARGNWTAYPVWQAIGVSGSLWGGNGLTLEYLQASQYSYSSDCTVAAQSSSYPFAGWQLMKQGNNSG